MGVPLDHVRGQETAVETLSRALRSGQVHHAYRFEGPPGVGKELAAVAFAQALLCEAGETLGCGRCDACRRAAARSSSEPHLPLHPDLVLVERGLYPPELIGRGSAEVADISVQQIRRVVLARASYPPHEGRAQIFLVRRAEELSISAANALLKTLEEPRQGTYFVLLCEQPDRLLPTIRSRTLGVRFGVLPDEVVAAILRDHGAAPEDVATYVELAAGSASAALSAMDPEATETQRQFVAGVLAAMAAPDLGAAVTLSESVDGDRRELRARLQGLAAHFARDARATVATSPGRAERTAARYDVVSRAIDALERNASTNLTLSNLVFQLRRIP